MVIYVPRTLKEKAVMVTGLTPIQLSETYRKIQKYK